MIEPKHDFLSVFSACVDVAVGWANGSIVNPTWIKYAAKLHRYLSGLKWIANNRKALPIF